MACLRATLPVSKVVGSTEQGSREGKGPGEKGKGKAPGLLGLGIRRHCLPLQESREYMRPPTRGRRQQGPRKWQMMKTRTRRNPWIR